MTSDTFVAGKGPLYRTDPRMKMLFLVAMTIWFFLPVTLHAIWLVVALLVFASLVTIGAERTLHVFSSICAMLVFMVLFMPLSRRDGNPLLLVHGWTAITREGSLQTLLLMGRFMGITFACTLVFATTRMHDVTLTLRAWHLPYKAALAITLAITYIPFVAGSFKEIQESHMLRRPQGSRGKNRLKDLLPTLTSALVVSLRTIPFLAMSLEQRGYGREEKRTCYHDFSSYRHPYISSFFLLAGFAILFLAFRK